MANFTVAITGGVASGKSEVARCFEAVGRTVIDADVLARELVAPGRPALEQIRARFGANVLLADGQLDRAWLRAEVFNQPEARHDLEAILHPLIRAGLQQRALAASGPYAVVAVPLLAEGGGRVAYPWLDRILLVDVPAATQLERLLRRDGGSAELAGQMLAAQASRGQRLALADDVIINDADLPHLSHCVDRLDARYRKLTG